MEYEERVVAFIDVLGWAAAVEASVNDAHLRDRMENAVASLGALLRDYVDEQDDSSDDQASQFSDSVIVSFRSHSAADLTRIVQAISSYQMTMILTGFPTRGGISAGKMHHSGSVAFGPALNRAVCLEKLAVYPRVIVDQVLTPQLKESASGFPRHWNFVFEDEDGGIFPDYLGSIAISSAGERQVRQFIDSAKIQFGGKPRILAKYDWLSAKLDQAATDAVWRRRIFDEHKRGMMPG
jgi:hypothetical protein